MTRTTTSYRLATQLTKAMAITSLSLGISNALAQDLAPTKTSEKGWELVWNDEFEHAEIDTSKWEWERNCWGGGNNELQCYTDRKKNSFIEAGKLILRAYKETYMGRAEPPEQNPHAGNKTLPYTSARLRSLNKGDWTYGRFEVNAKLPAGQGLWPAIWMLPSEWKYGGWAASGEIDIVEAVSMDPDNPNKEIHGTIHYGSEWPANVSTGATYKFDNAEDPSTQFHTYAIEWSEDEIRWYIDNKHYATQRASGWYSQAISKDGSKSNMPGGAPFDQPFHLLLNLAVGGNWPGNPNKQTQFPAQIDIDYVRVYQCTATPKTLDACAQIDPNTSVNPGRKAPKIIDIAVNSDFIKADTVHVFNDQAEPPFGSNFFADSGAVEINVVAESQRGKIAQINFKTDTGGAYWQASKGFDFSEFKTLEFDLRVDADPRESGGIVFKIDSYHPSSTGDIKLEVAEVGQWKHFEFNLSELVHRGGSTLNLRKINTPLVILPDWGNQKGVKLSLDNIRFSR